MAKNFKHKRTTLDTVRIKGIVSNDGTTITYEQDDFERTVGVSAVFSQFAGDTVSLILTTKDEQDVADVDEEE